MDFNLFREGWQRREHPGASGSRLERPDAIDPNRPVTALRTLLAAILLIATPATPSAAQAPTLDTRFGVAEGFRNPSVMADIGAGWERVVLPWDQIQPDGPGDFSWLGITIPASSCSGELNRGVAHRRPARSSRQPGRPPTRDHGRRSAPRNLDLPFDDPEQLLGPLRVRDGASYYAGRIDEWIIWNEPEFKPGDAGAGGTYTWLGTDEEFAQLLKVGYLARQARQSATRPSRSRARRTGSTCNQRSAAVLRAGARASCAAIPTPRATTTTTTRSRSTCTARPTTSSACTRVFKDIQKPLRPRQAAVADRDQRHADRRSGHPCAAATPTTPIQTTMDQQAAYAIQAFALAAAAGYQRIGFYQMVDARPVRRAGRVGRHARRRQPPAGRRRAADRHRATSSGYTGALRAARARDRSAGRLAGRSGLADAQLAGVPGRASTAGQPAGERAVERRRPRSRVRVSQERPSATLVDGTAPFTARCCRQAAGGSSICPPRRRTTRSDPAGYHFIGGEPRC